MFGGIGVIFFAAEDSWICINGNFHPSLCLLSPVPSSSPRVRWRRGICRTWSTSGTRPSGCRCPPWAGGYPTPRSWCAHPSRTWSWPPAQPFEIFLIMFDQNIVLKYTFSEPPWPSGRFPGENCQKPVPQVWVPLPLYAAETPPPKENVETFIGVVRPPL